MVEEVMDPDLSGVVSPIDNEQSFEHIPVKVFADRVLKVHGAFFIKDGYQYSGKSFADAGGMKAFILRNFNLRVVSTGKFQVDIPAIGMQQEKGFIDIVLFTGLI
jgi:hypothetical protein